MATKQQNKSKTTSGRRRSIGARRHPGAERAVLRAARELLLEKGYSGFCIEEVARRSGAGKPTIYRWWKSKAALLANVIEEEKGAIVANPDTGTLAGDLMAYVAALWAFWRDHPAGAATRGLIAEAQSAVPALETLRERFLPSRLELMRPMFERAAGRGEIDPAAIDDLMELWVAFNWFHLLTDQLEAEAVTEHMIRRLIGVPTHVEDNAG